MSLYILCVIIIVSFVLIIVTRRWFNTIKINQRNLNTIFEKHNILNCDAVNVPCVTDDQCRDNCVNGMMTRCNESGFCGQNLRYVGADFETCDPALGLIVILNALDEFVIEQVCVSMYRDVIDDNGLLRPYVCQYGNMYIDLENGPFDVNDCVCDSGYTKFNYSPGTFNRSVPVCIPNSSLNLYKRIYVQS
nr:pif-3 [Darna trima granulovirus]